MKRADYITAMRSLNDGVVANSLGELTQIKVVNTNDSILPEIHQHRLKNEIDCKGKISIEIDDCYLNQIVEFISPTSFSLFL